MKTVELSKCISELPVVENLKNFAGIDAQNALGMMSPERLAAVVGGKLGIRKISLSHPDDSNEITIPCTWGCILLYNTYTGEMNIISKDRTSIISLTGSNSFIINSPVLLSAPVYNKLVMTFTRKVYDHINLVIMGI